MKSIDEFLNSNKLENGNISVQDVLQSSIGKLLWVPGQASATSRYHLTSYTKSYLVQNSQKLNNISQIFFDNTQLNFAIYAYPDEFMLLQIQLMVLF